MQTIRDKAKERMRGSCRVCPACDGRACAGEVPGMGGLGTGTSFKNNVRALARVNIAMSLIHGVKEPSTSVSWFGLNLSMPVIAAPIGGMFNFREAVGEEAYVASVLDGCLAAGTIGCTGDGPAPAIFDSALTALRERQGRGLPFIKPWENEELNEKIDFALTAGCGILGMDIDAAGLVTLRKMGRPVAPRTVPELETIIQRVHGQGGRFILKGIMTAADALAALEAGADGIVVSNHGGRVLDYTPGTAEVLPEIARAVKGRLSIIVDGGVRTGSDVFKMIALGADIVGVGRPISIAAIGGESEGVRTCLETMRNELAQVMLMTGCPNLASITENVLHRPGGRETVFTNIG